MKAQRRAEILVIMWWNLFCFVLLLWCAKGLLAQPTSSTVSPRAFGSHSWRENGLAPASLPLTGNLPWDIRLASDAVLYYWNGEEWIPITGGPSGELAHFHFAETIEVTDPGLFYAAENVEDALGEIGTEIDSISLDPRWTDARTPLSHEHSASDTTSGTFSDARISSSSVTQHESALEAVLDLSDLQGAVTDTQVPDVLTISGTPFRCARFDAAGVLIAASGDCAGGDTDTVGGVTDHGALAGLLDDDHLQYPLLTGRLGGQTLVGGTASGNALVLDGSSHATDGGVVILSPLLKIGGTSSGYPALKPVGSWGDILFRTADDSGYGVPIAAAFTGASGTTYKVSLHGDASVGLMMANDYPVGWSNTADKNGTKDAKLMRLTTAVVKLTDALSLTPRSTPPLTCGAGSSEGTLYADTSHALCYCGNGAWINLTPTDGGSCS